jgi:penicillin-insensitive murein endopeptidase
MRELFLRGLRLLCLGAALYAGALSAAALPSNGWSVIREPTAGAPQAIGSTANGCLAGAARLPADGPGYEVIRLSRRRFFGVDDTVDFVAGLGRRAQDAGLPIFYVGDMAQPRGGPLPFGHASHQTGLDVDIWFTANTKPGLTPAEREEPPLPSMILAGDPRVDPARFGRRQVTLLRLAAADARVDRIFVNPVIKLALCRGYGGAAEGGTDWLRRLRPWWGHDDHFHVRLRCPAGSPDCEPQTPIPDGDGCDAALEDWTHHLAPPKPKQGPPGPLRRMPAACMALQTER